MSFLIGNQSQGATIDASLQLASSAQGSCPRIVATRTSVQQEPFYQPGIFGNQEVAVHTTSTTDGSYALPVIQRVDDLGQVFIEIDSPRLYRSQHLGSPVKSDGVEDKCMEKYHLAFLDMSCFLGDCIAQFVGNSTHRKSHTRTIYAILATRDEASSSTVGSKGRWNFEIGREAISLVIRLLEAERQKALERIQRLNGVGSGEIVTVHGVLTTQRGAVVCAERDSADQLEVTSGGSHEQVRFYAYVCDLYVQKISRSSIQRVPRANI